MPSAAPSRLTYCLTRGPMKAFIAAVVKRSNSRNCGDTRAEVVTKASGYTSAMISRARSSCRGSMYEKRKHTAMASTPSALRARAASRTSSSSSGTSTSPRGGAIRSLTPFRWRRWTSGRSCHGTSCMIE